MHERREWIRSSIYFKIMNLEAESSLLSQGYHTIGGIDEAGRGPLAGPVVAACVVVNSDFSLERGDNSHLLKQINDSKKLSEKKREKLYEIIKKEFFDVGIGICDHETIDRINILEASFLAMKKAIGNLKNRPDIILVDGKYGIPNLSLPQKPVIGGDSIILTIAAASIIAKVERDRIMLEMDMKYPVYSFDRHKGYGTKLHMERLEENGPCRIHRRSFEPVRKLIKISNS